MSTQPLVSIVIPAYDAQAHIGAAVASALQQTYRRLEVIVVDDGSTDTTAQIVESMASTDRRLRLIRQANGGVAAARNRAIEASSGDYVAPLDADDFWLPDKIAAQVERIEDAGARMGLVSCWWVNVDEHHTVTGTSPRWMYEGDLFHALLYTNMIGNASLPLMRRACLDAVGAFDPSLRARGGQGCEDWDLYLRIAASYEIGVVPRFLCAYRMIPTSMSADLDQMRRSFELVLERVRQSHPELPPALVRWSRANFSHYLAEKSYRTRAFHRTIRELAGMFARDPLAMSWPAAVLMLLRAAVRTMIPPPDPPGTADAVPTSSAPDRGARRPMTLRRRAADHSPYDWVRRRRWKRLTLNARTILAPADETDAALRTLECQLRDARRVTPSVGARSQP